MAQFLVRLQVIQWKRVVSKRSARVTHASEVRLIVERIGWGIRISKIGFGRDCDPRNPACGADSGWQAPDGS